MYCPNILCEQWDQATIFFFDVWRPPPTTVFWPKRIGSNSADPATDLVAVPQRSGATFWWITTLGIIATATMYGLNGTDGDTAMDFDTRVYLKYCVVIPVVIFI